MQFILHCPFLKYLIPSATRALKYKNDWVHQPITESASRLACRLRALRVFFQLQLKREDTCKKKSFYARHATSSFGQTGDTVRVANVNKYVAKKWSWATFHELQKRDQYAQNSCGLAKRFTHVLTCGKQHFKKVSIFNRLDAFAEVTSSLPRRRLPAWWMGSSQSSPRQHSLNDGNIRVALVWQ